LLLVYDDEYAGSPKFIKEKAEHYAETFDYSIFMITRYDLQILVEEEQFN
ncbi:MAG: SLOG family protein, partial [Caldibacillus sp.]